MARFPFKELLEGARRLFVGLQAKKSNGSMESLKSDDNGALLTSIANDLVPVSIADNRVAEQKTEADAVNGVLTFNADVKTIEIYNTDTNTGIFNVNGIDITVPAGDVFLAKIGGDPSKEVSISGATKYIVTRYV